MVHCFSQLGICRSSNDNSMIVFLASSMLYSSIVRSGILDKNKNLFSDIHAAQYFLT